LSPAGQWEHFIARLREALGRPLPGPDVQRRLAPRPRGLAPEHPPQAAAVLILLYPHRGALHLPLTRRTETVATHRGQISWPGGAREGEEPLVVTALRETEEELGVDPASVKVLGQLTPLHTGRSGYLITPAVGWMRSRPTFRPDPGEVAEVLEVPLAALRAPEVLHQEVWNLHSRQTVVPLYRLGPDIAIWGATAMILSEFVAVVECAD
jgi:8-oxo-dGTP pyrophosphatase MutT (NUDIX family)